MSTYHNLSELILVLGRILRNQSQRRKTVAKIQKAIKAANEALGEAKTGLSQLLRESHESFGELESVRFQIANVENGEIAALHKQTYSMGSQANIEAMADQISGNRSWKSKLDTPERFYDLAAICVNMPFLIRESAEAIEDREDEKSEEWKKGTDNK